MSADQRRLSPPSHPRDLFQAIRFWDANKVEQLLAEGADPNQETRGGAETALAYAARVSTAHVVRVLLTRGATDHGQMPLINAVSWNRTDGNPDTAAIARLLLQHGGDVNAADESGWTPLMEAVAADDLTTLRLYLQHGANVHAVCPPNQTALSVALSNDNQEAAEVLRNAVA